MLLLQERRFNELDTLLARLDPTRSANADVGPEPATRTDVAHPIVRDEASGAGGQEGRIRGLPRILRPVHYHGRCVCRSADDRAFCVDSCWSKQGHKDPNEWCGNWHHCFVS